MALPQFHSIIPLPIFGNGIATITQKKFSSILAIPLPQLPKKKKKKFHLFRQYHYHNSFFFFFPHIFGNPIATIAKFFLYPYFGNGIATIRLSPIFFFSLFRQWHYHKPIATIFFPSYFSNAIATNSFDNFLFFIFKK